MVYQLKQKYLFAVAAKRKPAWFTQLEKYLKKNQPAWEVLFFQSSPNSPQMAKKIMRLFDLHIFIWQKAKKKL